ncbi:tetratricopeptide repeat protein [Nonomuraea rubra]
MQRQRMVGVDAALPGSGYVIGPRLVLTSAHVSGPTGTPASVFQPGRPGLYAGEVVWQGSAGGRDDAALVLIGDDAWQPPGGEPVRWGRTITFRTDIACTTWGRPAVVQAEGRPVELAQLSGTLNPGDQLVGNRYVMRVRGTPPAARPDGSSPWAGLSGAALFCDRLLAGVVAADPAGWQHGHLVAVPAYVLHHDKEFRRLLAAHAGPEVPELEPIEYQQLAAAPEPMTAAGGGSPAGLLRARRQVVPFHGREEILQALLAWATLPGFGAQLVHGPAGQGKTRLAAELANRLTGWRWAVLWLDARADPVQLEALQDAAAPLLVVIDYAESRLAQLEAVLQACARRGEQAPLKLLLLARTAGPWWNGAKAASPQSEVLLDGTSVTALPVLDDTSPGRAAGYRDAARAFAVELDQLRPDRSWAELAADLPAPPAARIGSGNALSVHMLALADLLDTATAHSVDLPVGLPGTARADPATTGRKQEEATSAAAEEVEDRLLLHERRYWTSCAAAYGLHLAGQVLDEWLVHALAAAVAFGAPDPGQAEALLTRIPALADPVMRSRVGHWIAALYPPAGGDSPWGELQPDRLAERFLGRHLCAHPHLIDTLLPAASTEQAGQLLTVTTRAAAHPVLHGELDAQIIGWCLRHHHLLADPAMQVATRVEQPGPLLQALRRLLDEPALELPELMAWADRLPKTSFALAEWAVHLTDRLLTAFRAQNEPSGLALTLNNQSVRLAALGRHEEALQAITEAVAIRRRLAEARPDAFLPDLAMSLNNHANHLAALGRREEALQAITEAAQIYRRLAEARPDAFLPDLASSLNNQSVELAALGRREEALETITEAAQIYRRLVEARPDAFLPDLAASLNNQSVRLAALGQHEEALQAITEGVAIRRRLAEARPDAFLPDLASSLNNHANHLAALGRREEALQAITEAVQIYRRLAEARPDAFLPDLASSLNNQSVRLAALGRHEEALQAITEAAQIYRRLAEARPDAFLPDLAMSLNNQANRLAALGRHEEALEAITEAVQIYRRLAEARPDTFLPDLAASLNNQSVDLAAPGRHEEALEAITEAVQIHRRLAEARPDAFLPDLAASLNNQSVRLAALGQHEEALQAITEAVAIRRPLAKTRPAVHQAKLEQSLRVLTWLHGADEESDTPPA